MKKMRRAVIKGTIVTAVFFAALFVISSLLNKGNTDMTTEMAKATYPVVAVNYGGFRINVLHGYRDGGKPDAGLPYPSCRGKKNELGH